MGIIWVSKALIQKVISYLPQEERLNFFFQKYVKKSFPVAEKHIIAKAKIAIRHYKNLVTFNSGKDPLTLKTFEFGAGYNLTIPLTYFILNINHQIVIDIEPHLRFNLLNDAILVLKKNFEIFEEIAENKLKTLPDKQIENLDELKNMIGIDYKAPCDARQTNIPDNSIDFISNTFTIQHIPQADLFKILKESYRILKKGGIFSCAVDLNDQFSYTDKTITRYNYFKYSEVEWRLFNSSVHYQNRLRYPEYISMIKDAGFEILESIPNMPSKEDTNFLKNLKIDKHFKKFSIEELGITSFWCVLRKS